MNSELENKESRFVVRIKTGAKPSQEQVYFRNDMTYEFMKKWEWYFEYRAALLRVENPKIKLEFSIVRYDYELPSDIYETRLKNIIKSRRGNLTKYKNKIAKTKEKYEQSSLFPIKSDPKYYKVKNKLERLESELEKAIAKMKLFKTTSFKIDKDIACYSSEEIINY